MKREKRISSKPMGDSGSYFGGMGVIPEDLKRNVFYLELMHVFMNLQDGIYVVDAEGMTLRVNPAFEKISGTPQEIFLGRNVRDLVKKGVFTQSVALKVIKSHQTETIIQEYKNGKIGLVTANPIFDDTGKLLRIISNIRDITELQELYSTLAVKDQLIKKYSDTIARIDMPAIHGLVAESEEMRHILQIAEKLAAADSNILILGESGAGKGVIAKYIAHLSNRRERPFISINCSAIPEPLMESELFGYEKGAFTGASASGKAGLIEMADGGILFLDEIGDMPLFLQGKLLTFLETNEIPKIGAPKTKQVDVRVIAATNKNLNQLAADRLFRKDLYYRLDILSVEIPPLRERKDDIIPLAESFLSKANGKNGFERTIAASVLKFFLDYDWPGNVRQLRNLIEKLVVLSQRNEISMDDLPAEYTNWAVETDMQMETSLPLSLPSLIHSIEQKHIKFALEKGGSIRKAAELLGISPSKLFRKISKPD